MLDTAWDRPISIQSDYARAHSELIAFAASMGWLSNIAPDGRSYSRRWHVTVEGLIAVRSQQ